MKTTDLINENNYEVGKVIRKVYKLINNQLFYYSSQCDFFSCLIMEIYF